MCILDLAYFSSFQSFNHALVFFVNQMNRGIPMLAHALLFHPHILHLIHFQLFFFLGIWNNCYDGSDNLLKFCFSCGLFISHTHHRNHFCMAYNQYCFSRHTYYWEIDWSCIDYDNFQILHSVLYRDGKNYSTFGQLETFLDFQND